MSPRWSNTGICCWLAAAYLAALVYQPLPSEARPTLGKHRIVFQTAFGTLELALYPKVAPITTAHILELAEIGAYNTNHFFRVDKGFVAQTADITSGRSSPPDARQRALDEKKVPLEVRADIKHDRRGLLSMARHSDPNSGGSSFSIMLNPAPHLDMQYTIFGQVVSGIETLEKMEEVDTVKEGVFVMPKSRVQIESTYVYKEGETEEADQEGCHIQLEELRHRFHAQAKKLEVMRSTQLP